MIMFEEDVPESYRYLLFAHESEVQDLTEKDPDESIPDVTTDTDDSESTVGDVDTDKSDDEFDPTIGQESDDEVSEGSDQLGNGAQLIYI